MAAGYDRGKTGCASQGRGLLCRSINAKQTGSLVSLLISLHSSSLFFTGAYINFERRGEAGREGQMKRISGMPETSGFIFRDPERKLQIDKTLMF